MIPATALSAVAATAAGPAMNRFGARLVLVCGLVVLLAGLLLVGLFDLNTSVAMVFAAVALIMVGGAIVGTPQATVMMASAPADLGGAVAGVKSAGNEAGFSLGPTVFALVGVNIFLSSIVDELARSGITRDEMRDALQTTQGSPRRNRQSRACAIGGRPRAAQHDRRDPNAEFDHGRGADRSNRSSTVAGQASRSGSRFSTLNGRTFAWLATKRSVMAARSRCRCGDRLSRKSAAWAASPFWLWHRAAGTFG